MVTILSDWLVFKVFLTVLQSKRSDFLKHLAIKNCKKNFLLTKIACKVTPTLLLRSRNCLRFCPRVPGFTRVNTKDQTIHNS